MLDALRRFIGEIGANQPASAPGDEDVRLAVAALLYHVIAVDGFVSQEEQERIRAVLREHFGLDPDATEDLIAKGKTADREAVDLFRFTSTLKRRLDDEGRRRVIAMLWEMVYADGELHEFEDNVVWRVAELLGIAARERIALKQQAARARDQRGGSGPLS